jgi:hypothetical protein
MTQTLTAASKPVALDYDNTLVLAIELSKSCTRPGAGAIRRIPRRTSTFGLTQH